MCTFPLPFPESLHIDGEPQACHALASFPLRQSSPGFCHFHIDRIICWEAGVEPKLGRGEEKHYCHGNLLTKITAGEVVGCGGPGGQCREEGAPAALG